MTDLPTDLVDKHCPTCFIHYAAPRAMFERKDQESESWYCPNGHTIVFRQSKLTKAETELEKVRRERDRLRQNEAFLEENLTATKREKAALKGELTKVRKRVGVGVCPCCNRSFEDLARHMATKHADFKEAVA